jgi:hypothetical protein
MKRTPAALLLLAVWIAAIVAAAVFGSATRGELGLAPVSSVRGDARAAAAASKGSAKPAARVLVVALEGATPEELADVSRALVKKLRGEEAFLFVANGEVALDDFDALLPYRFLPRRHSTRDVSTRIS